MRPSSAPLDAVDVSQKYAAAEEAREWMARARRASTHAHPAEVAQLTRYLQPGQRVLNLGCGAGREAQLLTAHGCRVWGLDVCWPLLEAARRHDMAAATWFQADAQALPVAHAVFDAVVAWDQFIEHFHGRQQRVDLLRRLRYVLRPHGVLLMSTHNHLWELRGAWLVWQIRKRAARRSSNDAPAAASAPESPQPPRPGGNAGAKLARLVYDDLYVRCLSVTRRIRRALVDKSCPEVGDYWHRTISPARSAGAIPFHPYRWREFRHDVDVAGFDVLACNDPLELEHDITNPSWVRQGARRLYWALRPRY